MRQAAESALVLQGMVLEATSGTGTLPTAVLENWDSDPDPLVFRRQDTGSGLMKLSFFHNKNFLQETGTINTYGAMINYPCFFCPSDNLEHRLALPTCSRILVRRFPTDICCLIQEGVK